MVPAKKFETIDEYIESFPENVQDILEKLRNTIRKNGAWSGGINQLSNADLQTRQEETIIFQRVEKSYRVLLRTHRRCGLPKGVISL